MICHAISQNNYGTLISYLLYQSQRYSPRNTRLKEILVVFLCICTWPGLLGQDPLRFEAEVTLIEKNIDSLWDQSSPTLVFTGSSSIRMWTDLQERFPGKQILNTGFGGSQASDLLFYLDPLILKYRPEQVFIYEGDNDLAEGKRPGQVLRTLKEIKEKVHHVLPGVPIVVISAKPSIIRWNLRRKYRRLNRRLLRWTRRDPSLQFADVWNPMLRGHKLDESLFIEDGLHMNPTGYDIWERVLIPYVKSELHTPNP
jgi:lysophospholipase L1-like esterase